MFNPCGQVRPVFVKSAPMPPPILILRDIQLTFGGPSLLEGAAFSVSARDRLCLVGRNGSGKSTLLKIAAGIVTPDDGEVFLQPGTTIRYLPQEPDLSAYATVLSYVEEGLDPGVDHYRGAYLLEQLKVNENADPSTLSGGEARRAALARTLAPEPDILLLDEPTNHLDLPAIEWLESELSAARSAQILISHDRRFLENLSRVTLWLDRGHTKRLDAGFAKFEEWRDQILETEETELHKLDRKIASETQWLRKGVTARRKRNQGRLRALFDLRDKRRQHRDDGQRQQQGTGHGEADVECHGLEQLALQPLQAEQGQKHHDDDENGEGDGFGARNRIHASNPARSPCDVFRGAGCHRQRH